MGAALRGSVVVFEQATKSFVAFDGSALVNRVSSRRDEPVGQALVVAVKVIVFDELADCAPNVTLSEWHDAIQAF